MRRQRNEIINKIFDRTPGIYLHISFKALGFVLALIVIFSFLCIRTVHISLNPPPAEYPFFIDGKKIVFMGREPASMAEAREILASFKKYIKDGDRVVVPERFVFND